MKSHYLTCVGPVVLDQFLEEPEVIGRTPTKLDCTIKDCLGGGAINTARQIRSLGVEVIPIALMGQDHFSRVLESLLIEEMPEAMVARLLMGSRRSVVLNGTIRTVRHALKTSDIPTNVMGTICRSQLTVVAPMTEFDFEFVVQVIVASRLSILQMSSQQLGHPNSFQLAKLASLTIVNESEVMKWTKTSSALAGAFSLRRMGIESVFVSGEKESILLENGELNRYPSYIVEDVKATLGAGDCLTGSVAASIANGMPLSDAVEVGLASAAMHVAGVHSELTAFRNSTRRHALSVK